MISQNSDIENRINIAALGMATADDIVIEPLAACDEPMVAEMVRQGIGAYEEAGTVLASTFRRLQNLTAVYSAAGSSYIVAKDKRPSPNPMGSGELQVERAAEQSLSTHATPTIRIIGGAGIGPLHGLSPLEGLGEIRDLVVKPENRGNGIGARLLKRCIEEAKRLGYQRLYLEATPQMEQAQKLFMRYGFRPVTTGNSKVGHGPSMPCYYILETLA